MRNYFNDLVNELKSLEEVEIIMLGGSKSLNKEDELSDYDVYVYFNKHISKEKRENILKKYFKYCEIANEFWEEEDDGILKNGEEVELIYRDVKFIEEQFKNIFERYNTSFGYSTCMVHNILTAKVIYDKNNIIKEYRKKYNYYPENLKKKIVLENIKLLDNQMPSLSYQIIKAAKRRDLVSINHRITEYLSIYFDILFALNEEFHPGEKRLLTWVDKFRVKPLNAKENIERLLCVGTTNFNETISLINELSSDMNNLVKEVYPEYKKSEYSIHKNKDSSLDS